jgi:uncharacterized membrane protein YgcG
MRRQSGFKPLGGQRPGVPGLKLSPINTSQASLAREETAAGAETPSGGSDTDSPITGPSTQQRQPPPSQQRQQQQYQQQEQQSKKKKKHGGGGGKKAELASNPLGAVRKNKFKGATYRKGPVKPATKPGEGLSDKTGKFRMFRPVLRSLEELHSLQSGAMTVIQTQQAFTKSGLTHRLRADAAARTLSRIVKEVAESRDAEALRKAIAAAEEAGLTDDDDEIKRASALRMELGLEALLLTTMATCDKTRDLRMLRDAVAAAARGGLGGQPSRVRGGGEAGGKGGGAGGGGAQNKWFLAQGGGPNSRSSNNDDDNANDGTSSRVNPTFAAATALLEVLDREASATAEWALRLVEATSRAHGLEHLPALRAALEEALAAGVPETHTAAKNARRAVGMLEGQLAARAAAEQRLVEATVEARASRTRGNLLQALRACSKLGIRGTKATAAAAAAAAAAANGKTTEQQQQQQQPPPLGGSEAVDAALTLLAELDAESTQLQALGQSLQETAERAAEMLRHRVVRPHGRARVREARAMVVEALGDVQGKLGDDHAAVVQANGVLADASARLKAIAKAEDALQQHLAGGNAKAAPVDPDALAARVEEALDAHVPDDGTSQPLSRARAVVAQLVAAREVAAALQSAAQFATAAVAKATAEDDGVPNPYLHRSDDTAGAPLKTIVAELNQAREGLDAALDDLAKWEAASNAAAGKKAGRALSEAQVERLQAELLRSAAEAARRVRGGDEAYSATTCADAGAEPTVVHCLAHLHCYTALYEEVMATRHRMAIATTTAAAAAAAANAAEDDDAASQALALTQVNSSALAREHAECAALLTEPYCRKAHYLAEAGRLLALLEGARAKAGAHAEMEQARLALRTAIVAAAQSHDFAALDKAVALAATAAGLPPTADEFAWATTLRDGLAPELARHVEGIERLIVEWHDGGDDNDSAGDGGAGSSSSSSGGGGGGGGGDHPRCRRRRDLEWMESAVRQLDVAAGARTAQVGRSHRGGVDPRRLSGDNVCVLPDDAQADAFSRGAALAEEVLAAVEGVYDAHMRQIEGVEARLGEAAAEARAMRVAKALRAAAAEAEACVREHTAAEMARFRARPAVMDVVSRLQEEVAAAQVLLKQIEQEAAAALDQDCEEASCCRWWWLCVRGWLLLADGERGMHIRMRTRLLHSISRLPLADAPPHSSLSPARSLAPLTCSLTH